MKNISNKKSLLFWAMVTSVAAVTIVSVIPTISLSPNGQEARALSVSEIKKTNTTQTTKDISGRRIIGVTIGEDFSQNKENRNHKEEIKQRIFIDGKSYEFTAENIPKEIVGGIYDVSGFLDLKTNKVTLNKAVYLGQVFDGVKVEKSTDKKVKPKKVAVFLFNYNNSASKEISPSEVENMMFGVGKFARYFKEVSYGRQEITGDVFGWNLIGSNATSSCQATMQDLGSAITTHSVDLNNYSNIILISMCPGYARYGSSNTSPEPHIINGVTYNKVMTWANVGTENWDQNSSQMLESMEGPHLLNNLEHLLVHEFGHALGLHHANGLQCDELEPVNICENVVLGNYFDTMAYWTIGLHFNAWSKAKLGWFTNSDIRTITESGIYNIDDLESLPPVVGSVNNVKAYKIKPSVNSSKTPIWIEFRKGLGFDGGLNTPALGGYLGGGGELPPHDIAENQEGIILYKEGFENMYGGQLNPKSARIMYLRNSPNLETGSNPHQVSLNPGQTYSEPRYGLSVTTLSPINQNQRRFQVQMDPNFACERLAPKIKSGVVNSAPINPGSSAIINIWLRNMDYLSCSPSNITATLNPGNLELNGNTSSINNFLSNMSPDDERQFGIPVWVPNGTNPGIYNFSITLTNENSSLSVTEIIPITVQ